MATGTERHCIIMIVSREPSSGRAAKKAMSPIPIPTTPLSKKIESEAPDMTWPKVKAQAPRKNNPITSRPRLACTVPTARWLRLASTVENENSRVVTKA